MPSGAEISALATRAFADARQRPTHAVDEATAKSLLSRFGIATPRSVELHYDRELPAAVALLTPPLVLKLVSADVAHKSDVGGVALRLYDLDAARDALTTMRARAEAAGLRIDGFLLEEMAPAGHELVVGAFDDPSFGPVIMCGLGGVFVEILRDVAFRCCPITRRDAQDMLAELQAAPVLSGARGGVAVAMDAVVDALLAVGGSDGLVMRYAAELAEVDINPLIVSATGAVAVDARLVVRTDAA
ncbi:MAG: acetate--CoA ligase family protein [Proteobacteria bacterium]|nr:acetate--CoA ligase family protein [Pseudomonadota bacterium]